jgi:hypothetical protein
MRKLCREKVEAVFRMVQSSLDWSVGLNGAGHLALVLELHSGGNRDLRRPLLWYDGNLALPPL